MWDTVVATEIEGSGERDQGRGGEGKGKERPKEIQK